MARKTNPGQLLDCRCPIEWGHPLNNGLVSEWAVSPLAGWSGSSTLLDLVRGAKTPNDGTLSFLNNVFWQGTSRPGGYGQLAFNGTSSSYVTCPIIPATTGMTLRACVRGQSASQMQVVMVRDFDGNTVPYALCVSDPVDSVVLGAVFFTGGAWKSSGITTNIGNDNRWHVVHGVFSSTGLSYYIDGRLDSFSATVFSVQTSTKNLFLGNFPFVGGNFQGTLDAWAVFNTALSLSQIEADCDQLLRGNPDRWRWLSRMVYFLPSSTPPVSGVGIGALAGFGAVAGAGLSDLFVPGIGGSNYSLSGAIGSFTLTGKPSVGTTQRPLSSSAGNFSLTGKALTASAGRPLSGSAGIFVLAGKAAALTKSLGLPGSAGSFTLSGKSQTYLVARNLGGSLGVFAVSGQPATTDWPRKLVGTTGTFTLTGEPATFIKGKGLAGAVGVFIITGEPATMSLTHTFSVSTGSFTLSGKPSSLSTGRPLTAQPGVFSLSGKTLSSSLARLLAGAPGVFVVGGQAAQLTSSTQIFVSAVVSIAIQFTYVQTAYLQFAYVQTTDLEFTT